MTDVTRRPPFNIVFMGNLLYPQGMAGTKRVQNFIDGVRGEAGASVSVLLLRQGHPGRDDHTLCGTHRGVTYATVGADARVNRKLPVALWRYLTQGICWLRQHRCDGCTNFLFLYGEPSIENLPFLLYGRRLGYKVVVDVVEDIYNVGENPSLASRFKAFSSRAAARNMARFADAVIAISTFLQRKFESIGGDSFPVFNIPISVDIDTISGSAERFHSPVRVFYAGSFAPKDGVGDLIRAFEQVATHRADVELQLTGKGLPEHMEEFRRRVEVSPVADRIHYLGFLPDEEYFRRLQDCDIPCVVRTASSFADRGFPFKLGEYLATGRPVVASAVGDVPDYLIDRESAFLVEPGCPDAIEKALLEALHDPVAAIRVGQAGRRVAERNFCAKENGRKFLGVIQSLSGS